MWSIKYSKQFEKSLNKLDLKIKRQVLKYIEKLKSSDNPLLYAERLVGNSLGRFWRYRVGDYRIICETYEKELILILIEIDHRSNIYKRKFS